MRQIPSKLLEKLSRVIRTSNETYAIDKLEVFIKIYCNCLDREDVFENLNDRQIWRFVTHEKQLLSEEVLGKDVYDAVMERYWEAMKKYS